MANITYRQTPQTAPETTITKGAPLSSAEIDGNFKSLNDSKIELSDAVSNSIPEKVVKRDESGNFSANVVTVTDINSTSDRTHKDNIASITNAIHTLNMIDGVSFDWKASGKRSYGVIAQDLQRVLPELVLQTDTGLSVSYIPLIAFLIEAIKEQELRICKLESQINE